jgi:hypothetical protein
MLPISNIRRNFHTINDDLAKLNDWSNLWRMSFNANKTVFMYFTLKRNKPALPDLILNNTTIHEIPSHTHLGLTLNNTMTWNNHIDRIFDRVSKTLNSLKRIKYLVPRNTLQTLYVSLIRSVMDYADVIYDNTTDACRRKLESIQREAALICTGGILYAEQELIVF